MNWRLIEDGAQSGARNMARDEALLDSQRAPDARPVLRFYDWRPSCLSLGRFQALPAYLQHNPPVDWVRRPTGGRAVWHQHAQEITYSVAFALDIVPAEQRSVTASYRWISRGLLAGLQMLGIGAQLSQAHTSSGVASTCGAENCFVSAAQCDAVVEGRKLIGAAQCRKTFTSCIGAPRGGIPHGGIPRVGVLQHGAILLDVDEAQWQRALGGNGDASWRGHVTTLRELGFGGTRAQLIEALCAGMAHNCKAHFCVDELTAHEKSAAQVLEREKYGARTWQLSGRDGAALLQSVA